MNLRQEHNSILIQPLGRLDREGGALLRGQLSSIEPTHHSLWIVDLAQVDFIDSAGLAALVGGLKLARKNECRLVFHNPCPAVKIVFEISGLSQVFEVIETCLKTTTAANTVSGRSETGRSESHQVAA
jgi:anti-sigma B factor antagonist